jgi:hypothetical protein
MAPSLGISRTVHASSYRRFQADLPNERWQLDATHRRLPDGTEVEILRPGRRPNDPRPEV